MLNVYFREMSFGVDIVRDVMGIRQSGLVVGEVSFQFFYLFSGDVNLFYQFYGLSQNKWLFYKYFGYFDVLLVIIMVIVQVVY